MKKLFYLTVLILSLPIFSCGNGHEKEKILLIKTVFEKNDSIWRTWTSLEGLSKVQKEFNLTSDSIWVTTENPLEDLERLYRRYCSRQFHEKLVDHLERMGLEYNLITMGYKIDEVALKTMSFQKMSENVYRVSFDTGSKAPTDAINTYHPIFEVRLKKEGTEYKIDDVVLITPPNNTTNEEEEKIQLIKTVFEKNDSIWNATLNSENVVEDFERLYRRYCSKKFHKELVDHLERMGIDHDLITMDYEIDESALKTMSFQKMSENVYRVSFDTDMAGPTGTIKTFHPTLEVRLKKEGAEYKIDDVTEIVP